LVKHIVDTEFYVKFKPNIHFRQPYWIYGRLREKFFRIFVENSYLKEVTKAFPDIPSAYVVAAKLLNLGYYFTPGYPTRVQKKRLTSAMSFRFKWINCGWTQRSPDFLAAWYLEEDPLGEKEGEGREWKRGEQWTKG
jgi:hypothetical protein